MTDYPLTWLADALRAEGCKVVEVDGWKTRGRPGEFDPDGPCWHHTGTTTGPNRTHPTLNVCIGGRPGLPGPLCQVMIGYDGVCYVIAAGRANHAGRHSGWGPYTSSRDGNAQMVGFEIDYDGTQKMSAAQKDAATRCSAAVLKKFGHNYEWATRHAETSTTGKWDTGGLTGDQIRSLVKDYMQGGSSGGGFDMTEVSKFSRNNDQTVSGDKWVNLQIDDDGQMTFLTGPSSAFLVVCNLTFEGLPAGKVMQARFILVDDYPDDRPTKVTSTYPPVDFVSNGGYTYGQMVWANSIGGKQPDGANQKIRLQAFAPEGTYKILGIASRVLS